MTVAFWQLSPPPPTPPNPPPPPLTADTPNPYARTASPSNQAVQDIASEHPQIGVNIGPRRWSGGVGAVGEAVPVRRWLLLPQSMEVAQHQHRLLHTLCVLRVACCMTRVDAVCVMAACLPRAAAGPLC
ncbi:hypothetical protein J6590_078780 [Homalodisca vitripennis]|nr:hypothetical protein J6590_078780 [Homalodisca vitripennis]